MALYAYICSCGEEKRLRKIKEEGPCSCIRPQKSAEWSGKGWWRDIGPEPVYVESKSQLKELCKKHKCYSKGYG